MDTVTFPLLNLTMNINNVMFSIGSLDIYWYAIIIVTAMIVAMLILKKKDGLFDIKFDEILNLAVIVIPIAIISARIYFVIFKIEDFINNPLDIFNFRTGGLAIYGGIIGGLITCIVYSKKKKINLLDLLDYIVPAVAIGQSIGRWGNFVNIEAYGTETTLPWRMGVYELGEYIEVHPTFLYESIATLLLFIILIYIGNKRKFKGQLTYIYLIGYGFARMLIEGLRTDSLMLGPIRISQLLSAIIIVTASILYLKDTPKTPKNDLNNY